ncbi:MAG: ROK family protein [Pyrinomonadaceae bacterium]
MTLSPDHPIAVGIAVSSRSLRIATVRESDGGAFSLDQRPLQVDLPISEQIKGYIRGLSVDPEKLPPVCIAVPGMVERSTSRIVESRIPELTGLNFANEFSDLNGGNVLIENDANAATFAEFEVGAGKGSLNIFCAILGEGVGSGLILEGGLWRGHNGFAGELGSIIVDEEESMRLEELVSVSNIVRRTRNRFHQDSTSTLNRLREENISFEDILAAAEVGDDFARLMLDRTGTYIGSAIASVINLLNVEKIVLAGEVIRAGRFVIEAVIDQARLRTSQLAFNSTEIVLSELNENAGAIGAALIASKAAV